MKINRLFLFVSLILCLSSCSMAQKYARPSSPIPANLPTGGVYGDGQFMPGAQPVENLNWHHVFLDPKLQKVIELAILNNRDLRIASLNTEHAQAMYGVRRADLFPEIAVTGGGSKQRTYLPTTEKTITTKEYSVDLGITAWEVDLFGRIRSLKDQALEEYLATEQVQRGATTALIGEVARAYFTLAADREVLSLSQATLETQEQMHKMIFIRYSNGLATELDLRRSQSQIDTIKGDIALYTQFVAQDQNALNLLVGFSIEEDLWPVDLSSITPPADISFGLSSDVLLRRPDIVAAEHQLKASNALIGAARAAFFPQISLTTALGTASNELSGLFKAGSNTWSFAPQATIPIFDARVWTAYKVSEAQKKITVTQYEKTIQVAFREVADVLAARTMGQQKELSQSAVVDSVQRVYELSQQRYMQGIDSYLSVLDAQRSLYAAQQGLTVVRLNMLVNQVDLFTVLGGDVGGKDGSPSR